MSFIGGMGISRPSGESLAKVGEGLRDGLVGEIADGNGGRPSRPVYSRRGRGFECVQNDGGALRG
jgi:hypothetical protein